MIVNLKQQADKIWSGLPWLTPMANILKD